MKAREYKIMADAVDLGITRGWSRAHKYDDKPSEDVIKNAIYDAVMGEICENFHFEPVVEE